jgi:hypothetical protein
MNQNQHEGYIVLIQVQLFLEEVAIVLSPWLLLEAGILTQLSRLTDDEV